MYHDKHYHSAKTFPQPAAFSFYIPQPVHVHRHYSRPLHPEIVMAQCTNNYLQPLPAIPSNPIAAVTPTEIKITSPTEMSMGSSGSECDTSSKRKRSAFRKDLLFKRVLGGPCSRVRVWEDQEGFIFYDCSCGKRKPIQDLAKIKKHLRLHQMDSFECKVCHRHFNHYLGLNGHMRKHNKADDTV